MIKKIRQIKERGFTLLEGLALLALGSIILGAAAFAISGGLESAKVANTQENLNYLRMNIVETYTHVHSYDSITNDQLLDAKAVPTNMIAGEDIVNEWNGNVTVEPADDGRAFTVTLDNVPQGAAIKLGGQRHHWDELTINDTEIERDTVVTKEICDDELNNTIVFKAH